MRETILICLPFGGAGASFFQSWQALAPEGLGILPIRLPGREERFEEPPLTDVARAVDEAYLQVTEELRGGERIVLFGHSLGAVLSYELAHHLAHETDIAGLVVSGSPDPWNGRPSRATGLPDDEFVAQVERFTGYAHPAMADPEVRELVLPVLRADIEMHENYRPASDAPLSIPVLAVRGRDDGLVSASETEGWSRATTGPFATVEFDGGHMYLIDAAGVLLTEIGVRLDPERATTGR